MKSKLPDLPIELCDRLCEALLHCEEFDSDVHIQTLIANTELAIYHKWFLKLECRTKEERVKSTITYLVRQRLQGTRPALPLFLMALYSTLIEGDALRDELEELHKEVEHELARLLHSHNSLSPPLTIHPQTQMHGSSTPTFVTAVAKDVIFLDQTDHEWIIECVETVIAPMGIDGRKNLLRPCDLPDGIIDTINFNEGTRNVAEAMVGLIATRDKLDPNLQYLEVFLRNIVKAASYEKTAVETRIADILANYNQERSRAFQNKVFCSSVIDPENAFYAEKRSHNVRIQREEQYIWQRLQDARNQYVTQQTSPKYKIDAGSIIECNLHQQKNKFVEGLNGHYKGVFVFTVASIDRSVLKEYVLESLVWKLKQHIKRPTDPIRPVYLSLEHLDFSSIEQGVHSLQQEFEKQLSVHSLTDLLSDNQRTNLVIVIWHRDIRLDSFKSIALEFTERLKAQVTDILREQERCLILFWANYGPSPVEPLDIPTVLPTFEQFEVEHLSEWLEHEIGAQLRDQNASEQEIQYCRERLVAKVKYFGGRLPETYEILRHSLELGGVF